MGPPTLFTIPVLRYMKTYGLSHEQFAMVDGGGALIPVAADRAGDFPQSLPLAANRGPVYLLGTGESVETRRSASPVIPPKAGIQCCNTALQKL